MMVLVAFLSCRAFVLTHKTPLFVCCTEPDENWTVEEVLQWNLLKSHQATTQKHEELVDSLQNQFEQGKNELLALHAENTQNGGVPSSSSSVPSSKANNNNNSKAPTTIHIDIITGPHENSSFSLQPKSNAPCWVGRSAGKKFRDRGVSLAQDSEVSTTHGKFQIKSRKAYFIDVGSTNGTYLGTTQLVPNDPCLLEDGMKLVLGASTFQIRLS